MILCRIAQDSGNYLPTLQGLSQDLIDDEERTQYLYMDLRTSSDCGRLIPNLYNINIQWIFAYVHTYGSANGRLIFLTLQ